MEKHCVWCDVRGQIPECKINFCAVAQQMCVVGV